MIDTKKAKSRLLSIAFSGKLRTYDSRYKSNIEIDSIHSSIKKYKKVSDAEKLIDAPEDWAWSRLGYITFNHGQTVPQQSFSYIDVGTLDNEHQRLSPTENIIDAKDAPSRARKIVKRGDVIYSTVRPYLHNICVIDKDFSEAPIASTAFCVMHANSSVLLNRFLFYWLLTPEFDKFSNGNPSKGMLYPAIGEKALLNAVIPVPSIEEQKAIVGTLDEVFALINSIDDAQTRYTSDVSALKSKVIDAGIQGRLTERLPEDGTAQELFEHIQKEKACLIKEGKIKKQKPLPPIKPEEIPFEIPENWMWVRLEELAFITKLAGFEYTKNVAPNLTEYGIPLFKGKNIQNGSLILKFESYIPENISDSLPRSQLTKKCLLIPYVGTIGNVAIFNGSFKAHLGSNVGKVEFFNEDTTYISEEYIWYYLRSSEGYKQLTKKKKATAQESISMEALRNVFVPLPPFAEQQRTADRIEEILEAVGE